MKKTYQKPVLFAERFELVEHIAKICPGMYGHATHGNIHDCAIMDTETSGVFTSGVSGCTSSTSLTEDDIDLIEQEYGGSGVWDSISFKCYDFFTSGGSVFGS